MTDSKNKAELEAGLQEKTNKFVSQDKELFANLSKTENIREKLLDDKLCKIIQEGENQMFTRDKMTQEQFNKLFEKSQNKIKEFIVWEQDPDEAEDFRRSIKYKDKNGKEYFGHIAEYSGASEYDITLRNEKECRNINHTLLRYIVGEENPDKTPFYNIEMFDKTEDELEQIFKNIEKHFSK